MAKPVPAPSVPKGPASSQWPGSQGVEDARAPTDDVAAVADDVGVAVEHVAQLAAEARRMNRLRIGGHQGFSSASRALVSTSRSGASQEA